MFESLSHLALQQYWWVIMSVLGGALVFLMFVQGGQTLIYQVGKTKDERTMLINALGRKWEFTFTTLVTFGGAFFAAFPLFYSTSFGGAYWAWMILLFAFILQAVSYEFRSRPGNIFGARTYETFLFVNGLIGTFLLGVVVASFFTGSPFTLNELNETRWESPLRGLELLFNLHNLLLGLALFFLGRTLGLLYFKNTVEDEKIENNIRTQLWYNALPFLVLFIAFITWLMFRDGYAINPDNGEIFMEPHKYFRNLIEMPLVLILFVAALALVIYGIVITLFRNSQAGIWFTGAGTFLAVFSLFLIAGLNNTAFYPSSIDPQSSLTIMKASSSHFTLTVMSYVSLMIPIVAAYIWITWRAINKKKISKDELSSGESHFY
jgi:cytochrome d ubiquinol oxidase subunit II